MADPRTLTAQETQTVFGGHMKGLSLAGVALIVLGVIGFAYQGFTYTKREKVVDIGPIHATKDTKETIPISPILSGFALIGGVFLMVAGSRSKN
jgi:hypothetical protein